MKKGLTKANIKYKIDFVLFHNIDWKLPLLNNVVCAEGAFGDNRELPALSSQNVVYEEGAFGDTRELPDLPASLYKNNKSEGEQ